MEIDPTDLSKIKPDKLKPSKDDLLLILALIKNDFSDLVYLQRLHIEKNKDIKFSFSAKNGQFTGRKIYILRLALSHFYSFLEFLHNRERDIDDNKKLKSVIDRLSKSDKKLWQDFRLLAKDLLTKEPDELKTFIVKEDTLKILQLSKAARHNLTFHYHGASKYLNIGFNKAFVEIESEKTPANEFAYITELEDIHKDRSYYIDLSIQTYLEKELYLKGSLFDVEIEFVDLLAFANRILSKIITAYHRELLV